METKDFKARVKAAGEADGLQEGQFEAIVSVFGNTDSVGDVVVPGAFAEDLKRWDDAEGDIPVIWSHDWADPFSHIGTVLKAEERPEGLWVRAQIHDLADNPKAAQVYRLLKGRRVTQFSFAYDVEDSAPVDKDGAEVTELRKLRVHEVGPTLLGANQATDLLAVKAEALATAKAGRVLSSKNFTRIKDARDALTAVLEASEDPEKTAAPAAGKTDEPSQADAQDPDEDPQQGKSDPPAKSAPRRALAVELALLDL